MNQMEIQLDEALEKAREKAFVDAFAKNAITVGGKPDSGPLRIMFKGPAGSGKTSMIIEWAETHKEEINFVEFDAALLSVYDVDGESVVFTSSDIERMSSPETVVFIDNYQYLRKEAVKQLNRLLDHKVVIDPAEPKTEKVLDNVLLVIAAMTE